MIHVNLMRKNRREKQFTDDIDEWEIEDKRMIEYYYKLINELGNERKKSIPFLYRNPSKQNDSNDLYLSIVDQLKNIYELDSHRFNDDNEEEKDIENPNNEIYMIDRKEIYQSFQLHINQINLTIKKLLKETNDILK